MNGGPEWVEIHPLNAPNNIFQTSDLERTDLAGDVEVGPMTNNMYGSDPFVASFHYLRFGVLETMDDCGTMSLTSTLNPSMAPSRNPTQVRVQSTWITV